MSFLKFCMTHLSNLELPGNIRQKPPWLKALGIFFSPIKSTSRPSRSVKRIQCSMYVVKLCFQWISSEIICSLMVSLSLKNGIWKINNLKKVAFTCLLCFQLEHFHYILVVTFFYPFQSIWLKDSETKTAKAPKLVSLEYELDSHSNKFYYNQHALFPLRKILSFTKLSLHL